MQSIRPIKSEADYDAALARIDLLMDADTPDKLDELDVLTTLVEVYEDAHHAIDLPGPVEAVRFRMEQQGLTQAGLKAYIGSSAKVSEVLSGKRPLTLKMIRALNAHLGIPAEVLIGEPKAALPDDMVDVSWERFPLGEMAKRCWIKQTNDVKDRAEEVMRGLIDRAGGADTLSMALYRKTRTSRRNVRMDAYALQAWCLYVLAEARSRGLEGKYKEGTVDEAFLREVARLSVFEEGPRLAEEFLGKHGIALVYAEHLPKTYLDGAALRTREGIPVIGITVRYDRIDNFWFCLLHELAHIGWHLIGDVTYFVDDLSLEVTDHEDDDDKEREADELAQNSLIPTQSWEAASVSIRPTAMKVMTLAQEVGVHPAVVAGRVRKEKGNYRLLSQFVGTGEVRKHFKEAC
jgi:HTH-type transcriptional regulator / antitoxin HigA